MSTIQPFSLKDAPSLIEHLLPVQKLSAEAYKEQMAGQGKTLTQLGGYWKGRKPLILNKACILGCLLPVTNNLSKDLEIFEKLMAMDNESLVVRCHKRPTPKEILAKITISPISDYFNVEPSHLIPEASPINWSNSEYDSLKISWRKDISEFKRRQLESYLLPKLPYNQIIDKANRPEEIIETVHDHIWDSVNKHLGTNAYSFTELIEQLSIMRFGRRVRVADTFCGSGQIVFEAARLGCDVFASDLNPVACMLTWGAFNIIGGKNEKLKTISKDQEELVHKIQTKIDLMGIESDGNGWKAKSYLWCLETLCPQTGWLVPLIPSLIVSKYGDGVIAELIPDDKLKRYDINIRFAVSAEELAKAAKNGTVRTDGRGQDPYLIHTIDDIEYRTKILSLRGDFRKEDGSNANRLRFWDKSDFKPKPEDIFQERLYAIHWMKPRGKAFDYEFRSITKADLEREQIVEEFIAKNLLEWQEKGWLPDMKIEPGQKTDELIRTRGWTHWHHLFNPRQLLLAGLCKKNITNNPYLLFGLTQMLNRNARLSMWDASRDGVAAVFYNQALNPLFNYACRGSEFTFGLLTQKFKNFSFDPQIKHSVLPIPADTNATQSDIFITDPPYGDAVNYDEIFEFFIAWLRKNPPQEFANWIWDSRRVLAIKGAGEDFRQGMIAAYKRMTECMSDNGIQVIMFTHQSGSIWADMANIVWASGLQVTAAWYVVTETTNALREGSYVKGTVLLILRKRRGNLKTSRDDLAWEIQEEVELQVNTLTGLNQDAKGLYREENVFEDADIQMAGYAAALRVLTRYSIIDGKDMTAESIRPRIKGETTLVDNLIEFAVNTANQCLVPQGISSKYWNKLTGAERFYLKMLDMESRGVKQLDNYQNFAKAFKVRDFRPLMASCKANQAKLKNSVEFGQTEMSDSSELYQTVLRAILYALMELQKDMDSTLVLNHITHNIPNYFEDITQRELSIELANYLSNRLENIQPDEARSARIICELLKNQKLG